MSTTSGRSLTWRRRRLSHRPPTRASTSSTTSARIHVVFIDDFLNNTTILDGRTVKIKPYSYNKASKDKLPEWYNGLNEKFVHIITRDIKESKRKDSKKIREFRSERALRIHWIKPIIENCNDMRIRRFRYTEESGREREYFWFVEKEYIAVVEFLNPDVALITGFCLDRDNQAYFMRKFQYGRK